MKMKCVPWLAGLLLAGCATRTVTVTAPPPAPPGPSVAEIQSEIQAHVGDSVIISQIENSSSRYQLTADQIIALKTAGASDAVLSALINTAAKPPPRSSTTAVVVDRQAYPYVYVEPWPWFWWGWGPRYYYRWR